MRTFTAELEAGNTRVALTSFATAVLAKRWIAETHTDFPFLIDPQCKAYQAHGLEHSLVRSWSPNVWIAYARLMVRGKGWRGIQGDSGQLGGDFIVDREGILRLAYHSHDPTDRPVVGYLLEKLDEINSYYEDYATKLKISGAG